MKDYYEILEIDKGSINDNMKDIIYVSYKNKIKCFYNLPFLTTKMIQDIKNIKEAYYVLSDDIRRAKYNYNYNNYNIKQIHKFNKLDEIVKENPDVINNMKICDRIFMTLERDDSRVETLSPLIHSLPYTKP